MTDETAKVAALVKLLREASYLTFDDWTTVEPYHDYRTAPEAADIIEQLAANIEALTAKCEALGQEVNMAKYGQPDFAWSIHVEAMADLQADNARLRLLVREADDLIGGDLTGLQWKRECRAFRVNARAALTGKETK